MKVVDEYNNLKSVIQCLNDLNMSLEDAYDYLDGHNLDDYLFDVNMKYGVYTILKDDGKLSLSTSVEYYTGDNFPIVIEFKE